MDYSEPFTVLCAPSKTQDVEEPTVRVDPFGDLRLLVQSGEKRRTFLVSSKVMCVASPVWRAMLDPKSHFKEASPGNGEVLFEDDDQEALSIVLNIAHMRFLEIPQSLKYHQLLQVSIICDKYDIVTLVRPWLPKWLEELEYLSECAGYEGWLFIAWVFGDASTFLPTALRMVLETMVCLFELPKKDMPPRILG